jgi:hypothetical protein
MVGQIGDEGVLELAGLLRGWRSLQELKLWGSDVTNQGVSALTVALGPPSEDAEFVQSWLVRLDLGYNKLGEDGALTLARWLNSGAVTRLQTLDVRSNGIPLSARQLLLDAAMGSHRSKLSVECFGNPSTPNPALAQANRTKMEPSARTLTMSFQLGGGRRQQVEVRIGIWPVISVLAIAVIAMRLWTEVCGDAFEQCRWFNSRK